MLFTDPSGLDPLSDVINAAVAAQRAINCALEQAAAFALGALDSLTFGLSSVVLGAAVPGYNDFVAGHEAAFTAGSITATIVQAVVMIIATAGAGAGLAVGLVVLKTVIKSAVKSVVKAVERTVVKAAERAGVRAAERGAVAGAERSTGSAVERFQEWPTGDGFLGSTQTTVLKPGTLVDRFGSNAGRYVSPRGTPFQNRGMPSTMAGDAYSVFEVLKPMIVRAGVAAPWKDSGGGAIQYLLYSSVEDLLGAGVLGMVGL